MSRELMDEILDLIFAAVNMKHVEKSELSAATPLMAGGLGLDSIDILEVVIALETRYNVKIENNEGSRQIFRDLGSLTEFIRAKQTPHEQSV